MKRKILLGIFALTLMVTAGYGVNKGMKGNIDVNLSDLAMGNVEALAEGEVIIEFPCMLIWPMPQCHYYPQEGIIMFGVPYK